MKTCDVCKRNDRDGEIEFGGVSSLWIGTTIDTVRVVTMSGGIPGTELTYESPVTCELCVDCIDKVNDSIAAHMEVTFGLVIRR